MFFSLSSTSSFFKPSTIKIAVVSLKTKISAYAAGTLRIRLGQFMGELLILGVDHSVVSHQRVEHCCCCELQTVVPLFLRTALIPFEQTKGIIILRGQFSQAYGAPQTCDSQHEIVHACLLLYHWLGCANRVNGTCLQWTVQKHLREDIIGIIISTGWLRFGSLGLVKSQHLLPVWQRSHLLSQSNRLSLKLCSVNILFLGKFLKFLSLNKLGNHCK